MKKCTICLQLTDNFTSKDTRCRPCKSEQAKKYRKLNPDKTKIAVRKAELVRKYGITYDEFLTIEKNQKGLCGICGVTPKRRLDVDHNHETGKIRGLICNQCNRFLGAFGDTPEKFYKAYTYLKENH